MDRFKILKVLGTGAYGKVYRCLSLETNEVVAIKKFIDNGDDKNVRKIAQREILMLKTINHYNLVHLIEYFHNERKLHMVFELVETTLLDEMYRLGDDGHGGIGGIGEDKTKLFIYQICRGIKYLHSINILHRDIKPENILLSEKGVVKICDFGFARFAPKHHERLTDYVATRWYRSPELLVGSPNYTKSVDIWSIGCICVEILTGNAFVEGKTDLDQLYGICSCLGPVPEILGNYFENNPHLRKFKIPKPLKIINLDQRYGKVCSSEMLQFIKGCLTMLQMDRLTAEDCVSHFCFTKDKWNVVIEDYLGKLEAKDMEKFAKFRKNKEKENRISGDKKKTKSIDSQVTLNEEEKENTDHSTAGDNEKQGNDVENKMKEKKNKDGDRDLEPSLMSDDETSKIDDINPTTYTKPAITISETINIAKDDLNKESKRNDEELSEISDRKKKVIEDVPEEKSENTMDETLDKNLENTYDQTINKSLDKAAEQIANQSLPLDNESIATDTNDIKPNEVESNNDETAPISEGHTQTTNVVKKHHSSPKQTKLNKMKPHVRSSIDDRRISNQFLATNKKSISIATLSQRGSLFDNTERRLTHPYEIYSKPTQKSEKRTEIGRIRKQELEKKPVLALHQGILGTLARQRSSRTTYTGKTKVEGSIKTKPVAHKQAPNHLPSVSKTTPTKEGKHRRHKKSRRFYTKDSINYHPTNGIRSLGVKNNGEPTKRPQRKTYRDETPTVLPILRNNKYLVGLENDKSSSKKKILMKFFDPTKHNVNDGNSESLLVRRIKRR